MGPPCGRNHTVPRNDTFILSTFQCVFSTPVWPLSHLRALQAASCRDAPHRSLKKSAAEGPEFPPRPLTALATPRAQCGVNWLNAAGHGGEEPPNSLDALSDSPSAGLVLRRAHLDTRPLSRHWVHRAVVSPPRYMFSGSLGPPLGSEFAHRCVGPLERKGRPGNPFLGTVRR
jgi:hypothetical protein